MKSSEQTILTISDKVCQTFSAQELQKQFWYDIFVHIMHPKITYDDIDWKMLWQNAREQISWTPKGPKDWDKKAPSFAKRNSSSPFIDLVLTKLPLQKEFTVLDAGSGPGTLSLPIAKQVRSVTALDYSQGMLDALEIAAAKQKVKNIRTIHASWADNWKQFKLPKHDICIASRSLSVPDLRESLAKLNSYSRAYVFIVDRIGPTPFDKMAFEAVGRPFRSGPDYIYTVNTLYSMGITCSIDIISLNAETVYKNIEAAMESYRWMFKDLNQTEEDKLQKYILSNSRQGDNEQCIVKRATPPRWAIISWKKES